MLTEWHLNEKDFFSDLPEEKSAFMSLAVRCEIRKNDFIFLDGNPAENCFYLQEGTVKIFRLTESGKEPIIFLRRAGEMFGLAEIINAKGRKCNAQAITACIVYKIKRADFESLLAGHYSLSRRVIEILGRRLRYLGEQLENLMIYDVTTRLTKLIFCLAYNQIMYTENLDNPIAIPISLTQEQIASCTGSCQQTVSETLKKFQEEGLLSVSRKEIIILKPREMFNLFSV